MARKKVSGSARRAGRTQRKTRPAGASRRPAAAHAREAAPEAAPKLALIAAPKPSRIVYVLSDSTGNLPRHMLTAFLTQFPPDAFTVRPRSFLETPDRVEAALREVAAEPGIVFHAVVRPDIKALIARRCEGIGAPSRDLTGDFVDFLAEHSGLAPTPNVAGLHHMNAAYLARIKAIEFTLEHDDGLGLDTLHDADVVLTGVSRTSKTPTSIYLSQLGYRVGNVALSMGIDPPRQLLALPRQQVAALVIDPGQLAEIRTRRQVGWHMPRGSYNDPDHVRREIAWSRDLFRRQGWLTIDVTDFAIEETAARVIERLRLPEPASRHDVAPL